MDVHGLKPVARVVMPLRGKASRYAAGKPLCGRQAAMRQASRYAAGKPLRGRQAATRQGKPLRGRQAATRQASRYAAGKPLRGRQAAMRQGTLIERPWRMGSHMFENLIVENKAGIAY